MSFTQMMLTAVLIAVLLAGFGAKADPRGKPGGDDVRVYAESLLARHARA